jgi:ribose 5-phosphate isomerase A
LPVEVIPTASPVVSRKLVEMGIRSTIRRLNAGAEFVTDEGNLILDCECGKIQDSDALAAAIRNVVGVVEHGLFLHMAERALVSDGSEVTTLFK